MTGFPAIFKREIKAWFASPIAYAVLVIFLALTGFFFYTSMTAYALYGFQAAQNPSLADLNPTDIVLTPLFGNIAIVMLLMAPLLTMRLFAEEKKTGAFELLFSYPVRDVEVMFGKYLAALAVFALMLGLTLSYQLILWNLGLTEPGVVLAGYTGLFLLGAAFIALGLFVSTLTENQIVAAVITFGLLLMFWVVGWTAAFTDGPVRSLLDYIALVRHLTGFTRGVMETRDAAYFAFFTFLFLFLTLRSLESKRWRG